MISVVIPTYNDELLIANTIISLKENAYARLLKEIIVVDAGSSDQTVAEAERSGATVIRSISKNKGFQMNLGSQRATGKILYFIQPGTIPPKNFTNEIVRSVQKGFSFGLFTMKFNIEHWMLRSLSWISSLRLNFSRIEDQSLFVSHELFTKAGAFREDFQIMEDVEIINRLKRYSRFVILREKVLGSTLKYLENGIFRTEGSYLLSRLMYWMGYPQQKIVSVYNLLCKKKMTDKTGKAFSASFN
jgi:rSAM/selenodomain-associated transferase 2